MNKTEELKAEIEEILSMCQRRWEDEHWRLPHIIPFVFEQGRAEAIKEEISFLERISKFLTTKEDTLRDTIIKRITYLRGKTN